MIRTAPPLCECGGLLAPDHRHRVAGELHLTTPWARQYLPEADRPEVEAQIPEGHVLSVGAGKAPAKPWCLRLRDSEREVWRMDLYMSDLQAACLYALRKHAPVPLTVTTDAEGWITSMEATDG